MYNITNSSSFKKKNQLVTFYFQFLHIKQLKKQKNNLIFTPLHSFIMFTFTILYNWCWLYLLYTEKNEVNFAFNYLNKKKSKNLV